MRNKLTVASYALALALGSSLVYTWQATDAVLTAKQEIKQLQAQARTLTGKLYDQQEGQSTAIDVARNEGFMDAYNQCKQGVFK